MKMIVCMEWESIVGNVAYEMYGKFRNEKKWVGRTQICVSIYLLMPLELLPFCLESPLLNSNMGHDMAEATVLLHNRGTIPLNNDKKPSFVSKVLDTDMTPGEGSVEADRT